MRALLSGLFRFGTQCVSELSWTHYRPCSLRWIVTGPPVVHELRQAAQGWSTRALERQIGTLYYERLLLSQDRAAVDAGGRHNLSFLEQAPAIVSDPVMLEFFGLPGSGNFLEATWSRLDGPAAGRFCWSWARASPSWRGSSASAPRARISYVDLVFYNYLLKCFVLIDLKRGRADPPGHRPDGHVCAHVRRPQARAGRQPDGGHHPLRSKDLCGALLGAARQRSSLPAGTSWCCPVRRSCDGSCNVTVKPSKFKKAFVTREKRMTDLETKTGQDPLGHR